MTKPAAVEMRNMEYVGYHDLDGRPAIKFGMQVVDDRWYLYMGHLWHSGWSVLDVTDPAAPELVTFLEGPPNTWTLQMQVAEGRMVTALEQAAPGWGFDPDGPFEEGAYIWEVETDPVKPELLGHYRTGGTGTHRNFYAGGDYLYATAATRGYMPYVLKIVDIADPTHPTEIGHFSWPGQEIAASDDDLGDLTGEEKLSRTKHGFYLHGPAWVIGDRAYLSYGRVGVVILDVSDPRKPQLVSHVDFGDLGSGLGCHTVVPIPSRNLLVANSEAIAEGPEEGLNWTSVIDISDETSPRIMSTFPIPRPSPGLTYRDYFAKGGRFGPHNQHHGQGNPVLADLRNIIPLAYFNAGLRLFSIENPYLPEEVACFVPEDPTVRIGTKPASKLVTQVEDVVVDARGFIYCCDKNYGLFILRYTGELT
jgi:hypothetical protein